MIMTLHMACEKSIGGKPMQCCLFTKQNTTAAEFLDDNNVTAH